MSNTQASSNSVNAMALAAGMMANNSEVNSFNSLRPKSSLIRSSSSRLPMRFNRLSKINRAQVSLWIRSSVI